MLSLCTYEYIKGESRVLKPFRQQQRPGSKAYARQTHRQGPQLQLKSVISGVSKLRQYCHIISSAMQNL